MPPIAETDPAATWMGLAALVAAVSAAWVAWGKSRREIRQGERIDALKEWQTIHEDDRSEIAALNAELADLRRQLAEDRQATRDKFSRMLGHITYLERLVAQAGIKVETWQELEGKAAGKPA